MLQREFCRELAIFGKKWFRTIDQGLQWRTIRRIQKATSPAQ
jgi:hypothetical protein